MKICSKCNIEKEDIDFNKNKAGKDGRRSTCKICARVYYQANKDKIKDKVKEYQQANKEEIKVKRKKYDQTNKEEINVKARAYYQANKDKRNIYNKNRRSTDPLFRLTGNMRTLINNTIKKGNYTKRSKTFEILGCSYIEFMEHLNNNKYNFLFEDGLCDIDHIIPVSSATTEDEIIKLNHYSNFQLLPSEYNRDIKRANEWDVDEFEEWMNLKK